MKKIGFLTVLIFVFAGLSLYAGGQPEVPRIPPVTSGTQYLSPNGDGVQDEATIDFSVTIYVKSKEGYIPEYGLEIRDPQGEIVEQVIEKEDKDIGWLRSLFTGYKEFNLERSMTWDGRDEDGQVFEDGTYELSIWVVGPTGNRQVRQLDDFVVDTRPPEAVIVEPEFLIFSPNGDGYQDELRIAHTRATREDQWTGEIRNLDGEVVKSFVWEDGTPGEAVWDGTTDEGEPAPEGEYRYVLSSTDRAGNSSGEIVLEGIELDRTTTPIDLVIEPRYFSPNGDGVQDEAVAYFDQAVKEGILQWSWWIRNEEGETVAAGEESGNVPEEMPIEGIDDSGEVLPEGRYEFFYQVRYRMGNRPEQSEQFFIDVTPPEVSVEVEHPIFAPGMDGRKSSTKVSFSADEEVLWRGSVVDEQGRVVLSVDEPMRRRQVVWDGRDARGELVDQGRYVLLAEFQDRAGNRTEITPPTVKVDTEPVEVQLALERRAFSPRRGGMTIRLESNQYAEVENWSLDIVSQDGDVVKSFEGRESLPEEVVWDGAGAPDGRYTAHVEALYKKGLSAEDGSDEFLLDATPPRVGVRVAPDPFARTNGSIEGEVFIAIDVEEENEITEWSLELVDENGEVLRSYSGGGNPSGDISWRPGKEEDEGELRGDEFELRLQVVDEGGNVTEYAERVPLDVFLVKQNGKLYIAVPNIIFGAYKHSLDSRGPEMERRNNESIDKVREIYRRYPEHGLLLEGHALNIYRGVDEKKEAAEEEILVPLTRRRAQTVRDALVERGMDTQKIEIEYFGGTQPIAPVRDLEERWKNRRVEFIMKMNEEEREEE